MILTMGQYIPTNYRATDAQESLMNVRTTFITNPQATELMQPSQGSFHNPAVNAQAAAMFLTSFSQQRLDATFSQFIPMWLRIVTTVSLNQLRFAAWSSSFAFDGRDRIDQRNQLGHVLPISGSQDTGQGNASRIGADMMFAPQFPSIRRIRLRLGPQKLLEQTHYPPPHVTSQSC
jgi:hypothetical protein